MGISLTHRTRLGWLAVLVVLMGALLAGVAPPAEPLPATLDGDGDGWINTVETLLGSDAGDPFKTPESFAIPASCLDGADNDGDGATDDADPGCHPLPVISGAFPPAGFDVFESEMSLTSLILDTPLGRCLVDFDGIGPTVVRRGNPQTAGGTREIDVEIVAMQLTGTANLLPGTACNTGQQVASIPATVVEDPAKASAGKVTSLGAGGDFPANSFFDVEFLVDTPLGLIPGTLPVTNDRITTLPPYHTPNDPGGNPNCYDFGGAHEHCPKPPLDHFKCYTGTFPPFPDVSLDLVLDQFGGSRATVEEPYLFCNPVAKNRLPIFDGGAHLKFYRTDYRLPDPVTGSAVVVRNQFGTQTFQLGDRTDLAVPTQKVPHDPPLALDHYSCYQVIGNQLNRPVSLVDQFQSQNTVVASPELLCAPAVKNHAGVLTVAGDERWHLACYTIQPGALAPLNVVTINQFGTETVTVRQPWGLCVPSQKFFEGPTHRPSTTGLVNPSTGLWTLRDLGGQEVSFFYGNPGDVPFMGDWDCDGDDTPGLFRQSDAFAYLRNSNTQGVADIRFFFGNPSDIPLAGDWNGDGCDTVSIYRPSEARFYIINELGKNEGGLGAADFSFVFGDLGDKPVVGDWDGDGIDEVGLHRESTGFFYWRNTLTQGRADDEIFFGDPGDRFAAGDWGIIDGADTPAVFRPSDTTFYFRHTLTQGRADSQFVTGESSWLPVSGDFRLD